MHDPEPDRSLAAYALNLVHGAKLEPFEIEHLMTMALIAGARVTEAHQKLADARDRERAAVQAKLKERDNLREALGKCRDQFRRYEKLHALKPDGSGREKAEVNRNLAEMCERALRDTAAEAPPA